MVTEKGENGDRDRCRRSAVIVISFVYLKKVLLGFRHVNIQNNSVLMLKARVKLKYVLHDLFKV